MLCHCLCLEPLQDKIELKRNASDEEVTETLKSSGKLEAMAQTIKPVLA
jgi:ribosomal protein L14E/L6E/L27E